jgi:hypothetical protein
MNVFSLNTPVVFIVFNRPDVTRQVLTVLEDLQPAQLFVIADGPRPDRPSDQAACSVVRDLIVNTPWKGELITNFSETNLGCKDRVSSGLDWVFSQVDRAIILEDDCLPDPTFFPYCRELLDHYRNDQRVMAISGNNFQFDHKVSEYSYYFSKYGHCWGWATWKRAWKNYDVDMTLWPRVRDLNCLENIFHREREVAYWTRILNAVYENKINSWAYRWMFACWIQSGLTILPNQNLVSNIGFDSGATHTEGISCFSNMKVCPIAFPLQHPSYVLIDTLADVRTDAIMFSLTPWLRLQGKIKRISKLAIKSF